MISAFAKLMELVDADDLEGVLQLREQELHAVQEPARAKTRENFARGAAQRCSIRMIDALLDDACMEAAAHAAAHHGNLLVLSHLLDRGIDIDSSEPRGDSLLFTAVHSFSDTRGVVKCLLERGADVHRANHAAEKPIHAVGLGRKEVEADITRMLLQHGSNATEALPNGQTPFSRAVTPSIKNARVFPGAAWARVLLEHGVVPRPVTHDFEHAATLGAVHDDARLLSLLHGIHGDLRAVRLEKGRTLLHAALENNSLHATMALLEAGVDPSTKSDKGWTFTSYSKTASRCVEVVKTFMRRQAARQALDQCRMPNMQAGAVS